MPEDTQRQATLDDTARLFQGPLGIRSLALTGIFLISVIAVLYFARDVFLPLMLALLLNFLFAPMVRWQKRIHVPEAAGAAFVIAGALALVGFLAYEFSSPISEWVDRAPEITQKLSSQAGKWTRPIEKVTKVTEQVENLTNSPGATAKKPANKPPQVMVKPPSLVSLLVTRTGNFVFSAVALLILLYFLLASGDMFLRKLIKVLPKFEDKRRAVEIAHEIEDGVSKYLFTVAIINTCLGAAGAIALWIIGVPTPLLWGAMAGLFNFIPYLGALASICVFALVATATFSSLGHALLAPGVYLVLASVEGGLITPWIMGQRMTLNPVVIFLGLMFWEWLWGIPGAFIAVPILVTLKIFCDHIEPLAPIGEFLGQ